MKTISLKLCFSNSIFKRILLRNLTFLLVKVRTAGLKGWLAIILDTPPLQMLLASPGGTLKGPNGHVEHISNLQTSISLLSQKLKVDIWNLCSVLGTWLTALTCCYCQVSGLCGDGQCSPLVKPLTYFPKTGSVREPRAELQFSQDQF